MIPQPEFALPEEPFRLTADTTTDGDRIAQDVARSIADRAAADGRQTEIPSAAYNPKEFKVVSLRECPLPDAMQLCDNPDRAQAYWNLHIATAPNFNPEVECLAVLFLNTRRRVKGHAIISTGIMDTVLVHAREVFRPACVIAAHAIVLMHNHPSGDSTPSEADIKVTRDLRRAGELLKIDVLDHVVVGNRQRHSIKELGYFYN